MNRKVLVLITIITILVGVCSVSAEASNVATNSYVSMRAMAMVDGEPPNAIERGISSLMNNTSNFFYEKLQSIHADIDTIVYNGDDSFFNVEFSDATNNPIGMMGYILYTITKALAAVLMMSALSASFTRVQIKSLTKNKISAIEAFMTFAVGFSLMYWMPSIMNFCLDFVNMFVVSVSPENYTGAGLNFMETLQQQALASRTFVDAFVYGASVGLSVYFVFVYATRSLHLALFLFLFPIIAMYLNSPKMMKQFDEFISDLVSTLTIQPFDALMFLGIAQVFSHPKFIALGADAGFWKIVLITSLIPVRSIARKYLGFAPGSALSDMAGLAGAMGIYNLARGVTGGLTNTIGGVAGGIGDIRSARSYMSTMGFGENSASAGQAGDAPIGTVPMSSATLLQMPDISANKSGYGIDIDKIGRGAATPQEAYNMLARRGTSKVLGALGRGAMGATGGIIGGSLGAGYGLAGTTYGAAVGGMLGGTVGDITGNALGYVNPLAQYTTQAGNQAAASNAAASGGILNNSESINMNNSMVVGKPNQMTNIDINAGQQGGERPIGIAGSGDSSYNVRDEFGKSLENMPKEIREEILKKATSQANEIFGNRDNLGAAQKKGWDNVKEQSVIAQQVEYAMDKIKSQGYNIDISTIDNMSKSAKMQIRNEILNELQKYGKSTDVDLEDII